ncbi:nucleoside phosphorylase domain-containing protein, partial [Blyttiomyces helicus]
AQRIITVGDPSRANLLASFLDGNGHTAFSHVSKRGFVTITGTYRGIPVSIIAIGMGYPMVDMMVREIRASTTKPLLIVRFGSCGAIGSGARVGQMMVASKGAVLVRRNVDYFGEKYYGDEATGQDETDPHAGEVGPYLVSKVCPADAELSEAVSRSDPHFVDLNASFIPHLTRLHPEIESLEMETFQLLHIAKCSRSAIGPVDTVGAASARSKPVVRAAACAMVFADRLGGQFISGEEVKRLESLAGKAVLDAIVKCHVDEVPPHTPLQVTASTSSFRYGQARPDISCACAYLYQPRALG